MHNVATCRQTDGQTDRRHDDDANSRSDCVAVRAAKSNHRLTSLFWLIPTSHHLLNAGTACLSSAKPQSFEWNTMQSGPAGARGNYGSVIPNLLGMDRRMDSAVMRLEHRNSLSRVTVGRDRFWRWSCDGMGVEYSTRESGVHYGASLFSV